MSTANITHGTTGHALVGGFDVSGHGIQVDNSYKTDVIHKRQVGDDPWKHMKLVNLKNSEKETLNRFASEMMYSGHNRFEKIQLNQNKRVYFVIMANGAKYKLLGNNILKVKSFS